MPLYEYRCTKCGRHIEVIQKFSDRPKRRCKVCSGKLEKLISRTSFQLKGGGWYDQGYASSSGGRGPEAGSSSGGNGSSSSISSGGKGDTGDSDSGSGSQASAATA